MIRGVTYGPFRPDENGCEYGSPDSVQADFKHMAEAGINSVRVYTVPPTWLLDIAQECGLRVMVGLPWEQHITFLDDSTRADAIIQRMRDTVRVCAGHPGVLCYAIGNEIPASIVRWHGKKRTESFLKRIYDSVKDVDPEALVTYVNFPSTEYLDVSFSDFFCFNVYLEDRERLEAYLARLQNLTNDKPLVLAEVGLDSMRNGDEAQSDTLAWQIEAVFGAGAAGLFVFSWTDEWHRGGQDIEDWAFGLTTREREAKPALDAVRDAFAQSPFPDSIEWPRVSVLVCSYNGAATIRETLEGVTAIDYPDYEVIVLSDGSTDDTEAIAGEFDVRLIATENKGLSQARNTAAEAATGEIVAYIDDDAYPDPHWLKYIAHTFLTTEHAGVGGPNLPPPGDGWVADCVANAPGGPTHVLLDDRTAEHIPGCNMAFRRDRLLELGGFDTKFRIAGDDVDFCWRIQAAGWTLGYSPSAFVWHHRRDKLKTYLKQQCNYGRAEAMLEQKWPQKYNAVGHVPWEGRIYGRGAHRNFLPGRSRIYHGVWGMAPFQRIYEPTNDLIHAVVQMPEWYLFTIVLGVLSLLSLSWPPLVLLTPIFVLAVAVPVIEAVLGGIQAEFADPPTSIYDRFRKRFVTALLHLTQPLVRLRGRFQHGLTPWRRPGDCRFCLPRVQTYNLWYTEWESYDQHLWDMTLRLRDTGAVVHRGGNFASWDLMVRGGLFGAMRLKMAVEEHGSGKQLVRFRARPRWQRRGWLMTVVLGAISLGPLAEHAYPAFAVLVLMAVSLALRAYFECGSAAGIVREVMQSSEEYVATPNVEQPTTG